MYYRINLIGFQKNWHCFFIVLPILLLILATITTSVTCVPRDRPKASEVKKTFEKLFSRYSIPPPPPPVARNAIEVYIDASGSMTGFLNSPTKNQSTQYMDFITALAGYLKSICNEDSNYWYSFGTSIPALLQNPLNQVLRPWFYNHESTKIGPLIQGFSSMPDSQLPEAMIVITDGVQSTPEGSDFTEVVLGAARWLGRGFNFEILLFKSDFLGPVYSELGKKTGKYKLGQYNSMEYGLRPFYCYIFTVEPDWGRNLKEVLESRSGILCNLLNFPGTLFASSAVEMGVPKKVLNRKNNPLREYTPELEDGVKFLYWDKGKEGLLNGELIAHIILNQKSGVTDFLFNPRNLDIQVQCLSRNSKSKVKFPGLNTYLPDSTIKISDGTSGLRFKFSFNPINEPGWIAYHIFIFPTDATFTPPGWIDDWSTRSDLSISDFSKSLYFKEFITNIMMSAQFRKQCIADFYLAIKGR